MKLFNSPIKAVVLLVLFAQSICTSFGDETKLALFWSYDGRECFLSINDIVELKIIISHIKPVKEQNEVKALPQKFVFYYWDYSDKNRDLIRHSISFNSKGESINWAISKADSERIMAFVYRLTANTNRPSH